MPRWSAVDRACSRFPLIQSLSTSTPTAGRSVEVSPLLFDALTVAYSVAEKTRGAVDPTVGRAVEVLGYERDSSRSGLVHSGWPTSVPLPGSGTSTSIAPRITARIPQGVRLDLGSSAKALLADRAAARVAESLGSGALISVGGDVAVAGEPPPGGWAIGIAVDSAARPRRRRPGRGYPARGAWPVPAPRFGPGRWELRNCITSWTRPPDAAPVPYWRLVSAAGASCVDANALSTAAVVWGDQALRTTPPVWSSGQIVTPRRGGLCPRRVARHSSVVNSTSLVCHPGHWDRRPDPSDTHHGARACDHESLPRTPMARPRSRSSIAVSR